MKGIIMKDKITVSILCFCLLGIYWTSRITTINTENKFYSNEESKFTISEDTTADYIDFDNLKLTNNKETELIDGISDYNNCLLTDTKTDDLTFSKAFKYYRKCHGNKSNFSWKGIKYTTLLADEILIEAIDSIAIKSENSHSEISDIR